MYVMIWLLLLTGYQCLKPVRTRAYAEALHRCDIQVCFSFPEFNVPDKSCGLKHSAHMFCNIASLSLNNVPYYSIICYLSKEQLSLSIASD